MFEVVVVAVSFLLRHVVDSASVCRKFSSLSCYDSEVLPTKFEGEHMRFESHQSACKTKVQSQVNRRPRSVGELNRKTSG